MQKRSEKKTGGHAPKYPTKGYTYFEIEGYVQKTKEYAKLKCDFVDFKIVNEDDIVGLTGYQVISVRVPHSIDVLLTAGDHVLCKGYITSFWNENISRTMYEMVAYDVTDLKGSIPRTEPSDETPFE